MLAHRGVSGARAAKTDRRWYAIRGPLRRRWLTRWGYVAALVAAGALLAGCAAGGSSTGAPTPTLSIYGTTVGTTNGAGAVPHKLRTIVKVLTDTPNPAATEHR